MKILRKVKTVADKRQKKVDSYRWESTASMTLGNLMKLRTFSEKITDPIEAKRLLLEIRASMMREIDLIEENLNKVL